MTNSSLEGSPDYINFKPQKEKTMTFTKSDNQPTIEDAHVAPEATKFTDAEIAANAKTPETKSERFRRLAEYRTQRVLKNIRSLGKLSNKAAYEYTDGQLEVIYTAIMHEIEQAAAKFKGTKSTEPEFKLGA